MSYFNGWNLVLNNTIFSKVKKYIINSASSLFYYDKKDIFKAFNLCNYKDVKIIVLGKEETKKEYCSGILYGNNNIKQDSECLSLINLKNSIINFYISNNCSTFDNTLEYISKQGVLFLNTNMFKNNTLWELFIIDFLKSFQQYNTGIIYILNNIDKNIRSYINDKFNYVLEGNIGNSFLCANKILYKNIKTKINFLNYERVY